MPTNLDPATLQAVIALLEKRIADLNRRGPPGGRGYGCVHCRDAELHHALEMVRRMRSGSTG